MYNNMEHDLNKFWVNKIIKLEEYRAANNPENSLKHKNSNWDSQLQ